MRLANRVIQRDTRAVSRLLSWIEDGDPRASSEMRELYRHRGDSYILGLTGPPGTGKSTLTDQLLSHYRSRDLRVGVLAVDPTSPFSGGAILGDRIRMQKHATDNDVFIRSMASRNWHGGLSRVTAEAVRVLEASGHDVIIVETVGVGQSEVEIARLAYTTVLVCNPVSGDKIQALKAGVTEIADIVALNKADLAQTESAALAIEMILHMRPGGGWQVPVVRTVAHEGSGVRELAEEIEKHRRYLEENGLLVEKKREREKKQIVNIFRERALEKINEAMPCESELDSYAAQLEDGSNDPYSIAEEILRRLKFNSKNA